jgi:hypothetical protein
MKNMRNRIFALALTALMCLALVPVTALAATSGNLLTNPSFENGLDGWTSPDGKWGTVESESGYEPQDGGYFAWPTEASQENTYIYQDVSLSGYNAGDSVIFSIMICNYDQPPHDMGRIELKYLDSSGKELKTYTQDQRNPDWNSNTIIAAIPGGAATARVVLWAIWYVGGDVDAYYDNASLVATTEKYSTIYVTEKDGKGDAKAGDILTLTADNSVSKNPTDYEWSSSYTEAATVDAGGIVTVKGDSEFAIYAKDKKTGVVGVYWVNSDIANAKPEAVPIEQPPVQPEPPAASEWAKPELEKADELGLIPDSLKNADLTQPITRAEFAAVTVKVYENMSGLTAYPTVTNPFTDTKDVEVLKSYNANLMVGVSATEFSPNVLLNREQCATALTRVFKRITMPGWTLATDGSYPLTYTQPASFADDAKISDWAKPSVYFMAANNIIAGTGGNNFSPRAVTSEEQARNYASATREQALIIAVRMVENLGN